MKLSVGHRALSEKQHFTDELILWNSESESRAHRVKNRLLTKSWNYSLCGSLSAWFVLEKPYKKRAWWQWWAINEWYKPKWYKRVEWYREWMSNWFGWTGLAQEPAVRLTLDCVCGRSSAVNSCGQMLRHSRRPLEEPQPASIEGVCG